MSRLTKDLKTPHDDTTYSDVVVNAVDRENICLTKLKHYENLEEEFAELGVDLIPTLKEILVKIKAQKWEEDNMIRAINKLNSLLKEELFNDK